MKLLSFTFLFQSPILYVCLMYTAIIMFIEFPLAAILLDCESSFTVLSTDVLSVTLVSTSTTSVTVSWTLAEGVIATSFTISYSNTDTQCFTDSNDITGIAGSETMYIVTYLQEGTEYSITVTAMLSDGGSGEDSFTASTMATG